jgi:ABC-2 type transport system permease protein
MNAVRSEWTKLRTSPGIFWLAACVVVATAGGSAFAAGVTTCAASRECTLDPARTSLTGVYLGQAVVAILGVLVVGTEYSTGTMRLTLAAVPRRICVLAAKAGVVVAIVGAVGALSTILSLLTGRWLLAGSGLPPLDLDAGAVLRAATGTVLYLVLVALLSLGIATVVRDSATAIGTVLALLYVLPIVAQAVSDDDLRRHLKQAGPMTAGLSVQTTRGLDELPIGPWQGLAVVAGWAAGALVVAAVLLTRRDA